MLSNPGGAPLLVRTIKTGSASGSVMYMFENETEQRIFYGGECSTFVDILSDPMMKKILKEPPVDVVYLDNTNLGKSFTKGVVEAAKSIHSLVR